LLSSEIVTSALRTFSEKMINYKPYNFMTVTKEGKKIVDEILKRQNVIKDFLQCVFLID